MEPRQQRGLEIAAKLKILKKDDGTWSVPSQAGKGRYDIEMGEVPHCSCPDHESHGSKCKHIFGDSVRSKTFVAQTNEVLCKVLCHNICCVIGSMHEMGIDPGFGKVA